MYLICYENFRDEKHYHLDIFHRCFPTKKVYFEIRSKDDKLSYIFWKIVFTRTCIHLKKMNKKK